LSELVRVWYHESERVFADRLVCDDDRRWFADLLADRMQADFNTTLDHVITTDHPLIYADFMTAGTGDARPYLEITDHDKVYDCSNNNTNNNLAVRMAAALLLAALLSTFIYCDTPDGSTKRARYRYSV